jgi:serine/threonine protein kinase
MSANRLNKDEIFNAAAELTDNAKRQVFLNEVCGDDPLLREEIGDLLKRDLEAGSFLNRCVSAIDQPTIDQPIMETPGAQIGHYTLLQQIGEGGMGTVYMADQKKPVMRRVALKIVKPGMNNGQVIARFEAERQALAMMDHPNIAKVLDAGTTNNGRPYFVMELVKGIPVTQYCDERRLTPKQRLELFVPICHAVQHAHQKGIIHRDLKPTNILVAEYDSKPVPMVIDFGLAKAFGQRLTEKTMFTQYGQILGTIDYMSPEQASFNQIDVDTRSDIYSLGVLLYELLTGETPFDKKRLRSAPFDELLQIIRQEEPPLPSRRLSSHTSLPTIATNRKLDPKKLSVLVRGELDWIVMKAIDKERDRRYQSAASLAEDLRRYLDGEAVLACPPSASYQLHKFARRYRAVLASAVMVLAALLLGLAGTSWALIQATEAIDRADVELRRRELENRRMHNASIVQEFQAGTLIEFSASTSEVLDRMTARISRFRRIDEPEVQALQGQLLDDVIHFWDKVIAANLDRGGNPGVRTYYYRLQKALCLARLGDHKQAFTEGRAVQADTDRVDQWVYELARLCALCASATSNDSGLAYLYVADGIEHFKRAADLSDGPPPSADDPDLATLTSHEDFQAILAKWRENWIRRKE